MRITHPFVHTRQATARRPQDVLELQPIETELPRFRDRDLRYEVREEFREADRFGRGM